MAAAFQPEPGSVAAQLLERPQRFEFAQAVMLLERLRPDAAPLGCGIDPAKEAVKLSGPLAPLFAASAIASLEPEGAGYAMQVEAFGLGGPDGPLPYAYQEWLQQRRLAKDPSPAAFLQLFQHRLLCLLYRVDRRYRLAPAFARPEDSPAHSMLRSLAGLLPAGLHHRQAIPDEALLTRAALLADRRRSLAGFVALARHHFGVPIAAEPFAGGWRDIPLARLTRIGRQGCNAALGRGALAGSRAWDEHAGIRLIIGPLSLDSYHGFLPGEARHRALAALAAFYFGPDLDVRLTLLLRAAPAPLRLRRAAPPRLSWDSWLSHDGLRRLDTRLRPAEESR